MALTLISKTSNNSFYFSTIRDSRHICITHVSKMTALDNLMQTAAWLYPATSRYTQAALSYGGIALATWFVYAFFIKPFLSPLRKVKQRFIKLNVN